MKHFTIEIAPDGKRYMCKITDSCMETYFHYLPIKTTWNLLYARIFNLDYADFLRMVRDLYGATLAGKEKGYVYFYFEEKQMCEKFIKELERKFNIWKKL